MSGSGVGAPRGPGAPRTEGSFSGGDGATSTGGREQKAVPVGAPGGVTLAEDGLRGPALGGLATGLPGEGGPEPALGAFSAEVMGGGAPGPHHGEPDHFAFDAQSEAAIALILAKYPEGRQASGVIPLLYEAQGQMRRQTGSGWVPRVAMDAVAARLGMAPIRVYEVATFYLMFNTTPVGKYHLQVCTTAPCWLRGSDDVMEACKRIAGLGGFGESSADGLFTMTSVECLGGCANAPILQVNDDYYEDLTGELTEALLLGLKRGEAPPPAGSMIGRKGSAPEGGPQTLLELTGEGYDGGGSRTPHGREVD